MTVFVLITLSLTGLGYLAVTDPKRRRSFGQPKLDGRRLLWPARSAVFGPGVYLTLIGHWSGLSIWAGAVTTLGWAMAAIRPDTYARLRTLLRARRAESLAKAQQISGQLLQLPARLVPESLRAWAHTLPRLKTASKGMNRPADIETLTARIAELEARVQAFARMADRETPQAVTPEQLNNNSSAQRWKALKAAE